MPTYNRAALLDRALASVVAQTQPDWELLVIDDGSIDGTWASLCDWRRSDPRIRCWRHANRGQVGSRNAVLAHAGAPWIVFLDSDDELQPHHLERRSRAIQDQPHVDVWISPMHVVGSPLVPCMHLPGQMVHVDDCVGVGMLTVRRQTMVAVAGFPDVDYAEEAGLLERMVGAGAVVQPLEERSYVYHRGHADSITHRRQGAG
jgi:glycosyltransferase involved in cell wall biosynthesis